MSDARRWRNAMHALGLGWRLGMVDVRGTVCVPYNDGIGLVDRLRSTWDRWGGIIDFAIGATAGVRNEDPDPYHPSNLGHLLDMVCEAYGGCAWVQRDVWIDNGTGSEDGEWMPVEPEAWTVYARPEGDCVRDVGNGRSAPLALLDALEGAAENETGVKV